MLSFWLRKGWLRIRCLIVALLCLAVNKITRNITMQQFNNTTN